MSEELTRAAARKPASSSTAKKKTSSTAARKKTSSSTTARKKTSTSTAAKKKTGTSTAKKKTTASSSIRLSAAEKKLITNFRKCGTLQKQIISLVVEKVAGGITKLDGIERMINMEENNDQGGIL